MTSYIYNMVDTWNNGATTFTAIKMNVTDTASNASSLLMDLQVGGSSYFGIGKTGQIINQTNGIDFYTFGSVGTVSNRRMSIGNTYVSVGANGTVSLNMCNSNTIGWTSDGSTSSDTILTRRAAANLLLGAADAAAPVAQTLSVQSVVAGTTNTAGTNLTITGSQGTGNAAGGSIIFRVAPLGSSGSAQNALTTAWSISGAGHLLAGTDNTYDIGASGATRPRNVYIAGLADIGSSAGINGILYLKTSGSITAQITAPLSGIITLQNGAGGDFGRINYGGTTSAFPALKRVSANLQVIAADGTSSAGMIVGNQALATAATDGFLYVPTCAGTPTGTPTTQTGTVPIVVDTTNNKLYFYSNAAWRDAGP